MPMPEGAKMILAQHVSEHGWAHEGQTVVSYDSDIGMYAKVDYKLLMALSSPIEDELTDELVHNWMVETSRMN